MATCLAQSQALASGRTRREVEAGGVEPEVAPHRTFPGNRWGVELGRDLAGVLLPE